MVNVDLSILPVVVFLFDDTAMVLFVALQGDSGAKSKLSPREIIFLWGFRVPVIVHSLYHFTHFSDKIPWLCWTLDG
jgi:hypothetical protein